MIKKLLFLIVSILMGGMITIQARIKYVPLYIVDTSADIKVVKRTPSTATQLFITQDGHKLILPQMGDSLEVTPFKVLKDEDCVYATSGQSIVNLPTSLVGDYEVRLGSDTCYYHGYLTLDKYDKGEIPTETNAAENITLFGSDTGLEVILDKIMEVNVVEYDPKFPYYENLIYMSKEDQEKIIKDWEETVKSRRIGFLVDELGALFPQLVDNTHGFNAGGINITTLLPILVCCIQELKIELDSRTEKIVDVMLSRGSGYSDVSAVRTAIGNTLLSAAPTSVSEPAKVRYLLTDNISNAYIAITDMGGRVITRIPVSPSETSVSINSSLLEEGIFLCTLYANGKNIGSKRLVKTK